MKKHSRKQITSLLLALLLAFSFSGCSFLSDMLGLGWGEDGEETVEPEPEEAPEYPVILQDIEIDSRPGKLVSLSPAVTDKLFDLGAGDRLVAVSDSCDNAGLRPAILRCGSPLLPDVDAILEQQPHVVLSGTELPQTVLEALEKAEIPVLVFPYVYNLNDLYDQYLELSLLLEGAQTGRLLGEDFVADFESRLELYQAAVAGSGRKQALYLRLMPFTIAPGSTVETQLMERIGLHNIASGQSGWNYSAEAAAANRADFEALDVLFLAEGYVTIKDLEASEFYKGLQATLQDWYLEIDPRAFERQSLSMLDTLEQMLRYAHPGASISAAAPPPADTAGEDDAQPEVIEAQLAA